MTRKILLAGGVLGALIGAIALAGPAQAVTTTFHTQVISTPDDTVGSGPWARDTFDRTTEVASVEGGFKVHMSDSGTFKTPTGVTGKITGDATWTITGGQRKAAASAPATIDRSGVVTKDSFTGEWWKRFVDEGTVSDFSWEWTYKSICWKTSCQQTRTESSAHGVSGDYPSKLCPLPPLATPSPTEKPIKKPIPAKATVTVTLRASSSSSASPTPAPIAGPSLPVTGAPAGLFVGGGLALLVLGSAAFFVARRRKVGFTA